MHLLTHSTIVSPLTRIRQERLLPGEGNVLAKIGQEVSPVQVVVRAPLKTNFHVVPVSKLLGIPPEKLVENLLVAKGAVVEQGDPLIEKQRFGRKGFDSPVDGTLYAIVNGRLVFQQASHFSELRALARGRVVNRIPGRGVVLEINGARIQAIWDSGKEGFGTIRMAMETADTPFTNDQLEAEVTNQVLITGKITQADALNRANLAGINGLIAGSITAKLLPTAKSVNYPIFITDGIGEQGMSYPVFSLLRQSEAREVALFKSPSDPSDVRPEIIIPLDAISGERLPLTGKPLSIDQTVRLLREPYNNQIGTIVHIYQHTRLTSIGTRAYGVDVKLSDGKVVFVPIANLDIIV